MFKGKQTTADHDRLRAGGTLHAGIRITQDAGQLKLIKKYLSALDTSCMLVHLVACLHAREG